MTLIHTYNGVALVAPASVMLHEETSGFAARAVLGNAEVIRVVVEDPEAALTFTGHKTWVMEEDACASGNTVVWRGYVGRKKISRRSTGTVEYPVGAGRRFEIELIEGNTFLVRRVLRATATTCGRPVETVSQRITWLLTTVGFSGLIADHGLVEASSVSMDATDYQDRTGQDVLQDCALASGFNYFIRWREASSDYELVFQAATSAADVSSLRISNVETDIDFATTWPANAEAYGEQNPERVASGVALPYSGGSVYVTDAAVGSAFANVDLVAPTATVTSATTATTLANRLLAQHATEEETVHDVIQVPAANLNDVKHGQLISARYSHIPGWESFRDARVLLKSFQRPGNLTQAVYDVALDLKPAVPADVVATDARLMRPSKNGGADLGYVGAGLYKPVHHMHDGDDPQSGDTAYPLVGLAEYIGSAGDRTGIRVLGSGTITVVLAFSCSRVTDPPPGGLTLNAYVYINGAGSVIGTVTFADSGLTTYSWQPIAGSSLTGTYSVVTNDELTWGLENTMGDAMSSLPIGTGNGSHWFRVYGNLVA